jgi:uncharacterized membrane protein YgcG
VRVAVAHIAATVLAASPGFAQTAAEQPVETAGLGTMLGIGLFLLVAALIVVSFACKLLVLFGLVPNKKTSRLRRTVLWLANVAGEVRVTPGRNDRGGRSSSGRGGSGSSGGAGASGDF